MQNSTNMLSNDDGRFLVTAEVNEKNASIHKLCLESLTVH